MASKAIVSIEHKSKLSSDDWRELSAMMQRLHAQERMWRESFEEKQKQTGMVCSGFIPDPWTTKKTKWMLKDDDIIAILTDYPQVIDFSGHSHAPVNDPRSIHQKYFTSLGTGSFSYFELDEFDFMYGTVPPDCDECAQYYIVEADKDNRVRILAVDVLTESFFNDGYLIETPWEPDSFIYTDRRALTESAPYFPADFSCKTDVKDDSLFISFSQAKSDSFGVDSYSVVLRENDSNSILAQKKISSSYYRKNMPQFLELNIDKPKNKGIYRIEITANGFWHAKSDKFTHIFTL